MTTLHKQISDIRDLYPDELDFVGGASECYIETQSWTETTSTDSNGNVTVTRTLADDTFSPDE